MTSNNKCKQSILIKLRFLLLGVQWEGGLLIRLLVYFLLIGIGFVYLYPLIYMGSYSLKSLDDLLNPLVNWIPTSLYLDNYETAGKVLKFVPTLLKTLYVTALPALVQTAVAALIDRKSVV